MNVSSKVKREEREKQLVLRHKYLNRIAKVRLGQEALARHDYGNALKHFIEYMNIMAEFKKCPDLYSLRIGNFDVKSEITEMLMLSHVYLEMARLYDSTPKFNQECKKALDQFVHFSANQPYQVVNSELIRKHLKKSKLKNHVDFRHAYEQIFVQSKKCYVVTYCFGEEHSVTRDCRELKDLLLQFSLGQILVGAYYHLSSTFIDRWGQSLTAQLLGRFFVRPLLLVFSKTLLPIILKRC